ncbi:MAG TPA: thioredoxin family protein [Archangium sp.]|uniref:thioredoxin family protein n=1 Tax=Archangium sp. TaxID=1872627 RepID=UPI002ED99135
MRPANPGATHALPRWLLVVVPLLLAARVASGLYEKDHPPVPSSLVAWVPLEQAEALSRERGVPILYEFSADWCGPCHMLERDVFDSDADARRLNARYVAVRVKDRREEEGENPPAVQALIDKYKVGAFPTLVLVMPDGKELGQKRGYHGYTETLKFLRLPTPSGRRPAPRR